MAINDSSDEANFLSKTVPNSVRPIARGFSFRINAVLIVSTIVWGSAFLIVQQTIKLISPFQYLALGYGVATITLACVFRRRLMRITRIELSSGIVIGLFLFTGTALQTHGLQYTTSSKAAFLTGLYVPFVPLLALLFLRQRPTIEAIMGIVLSVLGLVLISINSQFNFQFGSGEALLLGCALAFAMHIVCISKFVKDFDPINLTIVQLGTTSLFCFISLLLFHESFTWPPLSAWLVICFFGIVELAFSFLAMNWAQQYISSTRATLIYALEPAWAALFGYLAGQGLSLPAWIGCICIFFSMVVGSLRLHALWRKRLSSAAIG